MGEPIEFLVSRSADTFQVRSRGLRDQLGGELLAAVTEEWAIEDAIILVKLAVTEAGARPASSDVWWSPGGFRKIRWTREEDVFRAEERDGRMFRPTIQRAAAEWGAQAWVCERHGSGCDRIMEESLVALAPRTLRPGVPVEGTRHRMTGDNSGWILIDDEFTGGAEDLRTDHAAHVATVRPDLVRYFGLPVGWRFFRNAEGEHVERVSDL